MAKRSSFTAVLQDIIIQLRSLRWCHDKWRIGKRSGQILKVLAGSADNENQAVIIKYTMYTNVLIKNNKICSWTVA